MFVEVGAVDKELVIDAVVIDFYVGLYQPAPLHACVQGLSGGVVFLCEAVE